MDQAICLILGQVSLSLFLLEEKPPDVFLWSGRQTDKKAANIQARSFMARTLDEIGKKCPAEGEAKVVT